MGQLRVEDDFNPFITTCVGLFSGFDIRITPTVDFKEFEEKIKKWCLDAGDDVFYEFKQVSKFLHCYTLTEEYQEFCNDL